MGEEIGGLECVNHDSPCAKMEEDGRMWRTTVTRRRIDPIHKSRHTHAAAHKQPHTSSRTHAAAHTHHGTHGCSTYGEVPMFVRGSFGSGRSLSQMAGGKMNTNATLEVAPTIPKT